MGKFDPDNVSIGSELVLSLTQTQSGSTINSSGAEVMTKQTFTYGTFEFTSRVVNVLSGSVMTGFFYASDSITEIDMEQVGNKPDAVDCTNWHGESNFQDTEVFGFDQGNSHDFKIVWQPSYVDWYVDGDLVVHHTQAVPSAGCAIFVQHMGHEQVELGRHRDHRTDPVHVHQQLQVHAVNMGRCRDRAGISKLVKTLSLTKDVVFRRGIAFEKAQRILLIARLVNEKVRVSKRRWHAARSF